MKKYPRLISLVLFCVFFALGCDAAGKSKVETKDFETAPDFQLTDLQYKTVSLSDYKDKKGVILFFWTSWCTFCRGELERMNQEYTELEKDSIGLLTINVGEGRGRVESFVNSQKLNFTVLLDENSHVSDMYEVIGVPTYILINKSGRIIFNSSSFPRAKLKELVGD